MARRKLVVIVLVVLLMPIGAVAGFESYQRVAVSNCSFKLDRIEVSDFRVPDVSLLNIPSIIMSIASGSVTGGLGTVLGLIELARTLINVANTIEGVLAETSFTLDLYVEIENPSFMSVKIDRADIDVILNDYPLDTIYIQNLLEIPPHGRNVVPVKGLTFTLKDAIEVVNRIVGNDYRVDLEFPITTYMKTLFMEVPIDGKLLTSFYLLPHKPTLADVQLDPLNGLFQVELRNDYDVPMLGELKVGLLKDPFWSADIGWINFVRIAFFHDFLNIPVWSEYFEIDPNDTASLTIKYSDLKPNARHVFITFWTPDVQKLPYKATLQVGDLLATTRMGYLNLENSLVRTAQAVVYHISNDFGYVGNKEFRTHVQVAGAWWEDINANRITSARKDQTVKGCVGISTDMCGVFDVSVRKDIAFWADSEWRSSSSFLMTDDATLYVEFSVDSSQSYGGWPGQCRGYFIKVVVNGIQIYEMGEYPPRLAIS